MTKAEQDAKIAAHHAQEAWIALGCEHTWREVEALIPAIVDYLAQRAMIAPGFVVERERVVSAVWDVIFNDVRAGDPAADGVRRATEIANDVVAKALRS